MQILSAQVQLLPLNRFSQTRGLVLVLVGSLALRLILWNFGITLRPKESDCIWKIWTLPEPVDSVAVDKLHH